MLGIVHHSPITLSVILERERFIKQHITESEGRDGSWIEKLTDFAKLPKDGRQPVIFIERLPTLQAMLRDGFDSEPFKVVLFDDLDVLGSIDSLNIVDAKWDSAETWRIYKLMPEKFNNALGTADAGVLGGIESVTPPKPQAVEALEAVKQTRKSKGKGKGKSTLANADEVMKSIIGGVAAEEPSPEPAQASPEPEYELDDVPPPPKVEKPSEAPVEVAVPDIQVDTEPEMEPPEPPKRPNKTASTEETTEDTKPAKKKAKKRKKIKPAATESHKLF